MDKITELTLEVKVCDVIIEYLCAQLAKYRHKRKNKKEELKVCQDLVKAQKKN